MDNLNPLGEIKEKEIFSSGFTWRPKILSTLDYNSFQTKFPLQKTRLVILCGVSTAGKDTLLKKVAETTPIAIIPRATSRSPRPYEKDGVEYFFDIKGALLWSTYAGNIYAVKEKALKMLSDKKEAVMINGIVYAPTLKELLEKLGAKVTIVYVLPGKITDSLKTLQGTVMDRLTIRDENDKRVASVMNELETVLKNKDYLQSLGAIFIENEPSGKGYSEKAAKQLLTVIGRGKRT